MTAKEWRVNTTKNYIVKSNHYIEEKVFAKDQLRLVRSGEDYFRTAIDMIGKAKHTIYLLTYIFNKDETGDQITVALLDAVKRKVKVYMMADAYASSELPKSFVQSLVLAGINFKFFNPILKEGSFYFGRRLHAKVMVIDGKIAMIGGMNIADRYNDTLNSHAWLDYAVKMHSTLAIQVEAICQSIFEYGRLKNIISKGYVQNQLKYYHVVINDWLYQKNEITHTYARMFQHSKERIIILCSYFIPGINIRNLIRNATDRGVIVEIIMAGDSDVPIAKYAERWLYDWLLRHHVKLYEYRPNILHGKMALMDDTMATIGSYNVNNISAYASVEMNVNIEEKTFLKQLRNELNLIKQHECVPIDKNYHLNNKTWFKQLVRWMSYIIYRTIFILTTFYYRPKTQ